MLQIHEVSGNFSHIQINKMQWKSRLSIEPGECSISKHTVNLIRHGEKHVNGRARLTYQLLTNYT
jgi:hypothetical protein